MQLDLSSGRVDSAEWIPSPNFDARDPGCNPELILLHCISLPPGQYGGGEIERFFQNRLSAKEHSYFESMAHLTVSSHFLIKRNGNLVQFVRTDKRAWHAGDSRCFERPKVNNFSIGIELEGWDEDENGFTDTQYETLQALTICLRERYPTIGRNSIFAHSDVAPGRKPDPGPYFDWVRYLRELDKMSI